MNEDQVQLITTFFESLPVAEQGDLKYFKREVNGKYISFVFLDAAGQGGLAYITDK